MPIILRNKTATIEIDINVNLQHIIGKGSFDVTLLNTGDGTPIVWLLFRRSGQIQDNIGLDWRDISEPEVASAEALRDLILGWNIGPIIVTESALPTGAATAAKQDLLLTELEKKADLTEAQPISAATLPLPTGAATADNQINGSQKAQITQNVVADANNSSDTNLGTPLYAFTGTKTSTLGVSGIQLSLYADKNCTVSVQQSPNATPNWDLVDNYNYYANTNFGITVQAISSYVRVVVTTASLTTTVFRLQTALCPIVEAVPRSLDSYGNFKVAIQSSKDNFGFDNSNTPVGEERTVMPTRLVGANFEGTTIDTNFWISGVANSGTVAQANAEVVLSTTITAANGMARFYTFRRARYVSGSSMVYRSVIQLSAAAANNKRRWGVAYASTMPTTGTTDLMTDGAWFQFDGTVFGVAIRRAGVINETLIASGDFNGTLGKTYTPGTTVKTFEIYWTNSKVIFVIGQDILHTITAGVTTWSSTMNFYIYMDNVNSNNLQTNHTLSVRVASIRRLGQLLTQPTSYYFANGQTAGINLKLSAGNLHSIIITQASAGAVLTLSDSISAATPALFVSGALTAKVDPLALDMKGVPFFFGLRLTTNDKNLSCVIIYE